MGLFAKPEVIILKESTYAKEYLAKLEATLPNITGQIKEKLEKEIAITKAGIIGEENILFELKNSSIDLVVLHDIFLETKDGRSAQIDFIVVAPKIIYLLETKNLYGNIEINSKGDFIRNMEYGGKWHKEGIYSPITQNQRHLEILKDASSENKGFIKEQLFRHYYDSCHKSLIVLSNPKTIVNDKYASKEIKKKVIRADQLVATIIQMEKESKEPSSNKKQMKLIAESILKIESNNRKDYFEKYQFLEEMRGAEDINLVKDTEPEKLICPKCGSELVLRIAKKGDNAGRKFYGCSNFPKCRYIRDL